MIIDSHCHAWETWPFSPPVSDPGTRGRMEQLIYEMDRAGVDQAVVICAAIGDNPENNRYVFDEASRHGDRIVAFADIDSRWLDEHHSAGADRRLATAAARWDLVGFTHYLREDEDAKWLLSGDGLAFLRTAEDLGLILSLAATTRQLAAVQAAAERVPTLPILLHHMGHVTPERGRGHTGVRELIHAAESANIHVKLSGFGYAAPDGEYPYRELEWVVRLLYETFGPERLSWGSDHPVVGRFMTYPQSLAVARHLTGFASDADRELMFGGNLARLLAGAEADRLSRRQTGHVV